MHIALKEPKAAVVWLERIEATLRQQLVARPDNQMLKDKLRQVETLKSEISGDNPQGIP